MLSQRISLFLLVPLGMLGMLGMLGQTRPARPEFDVASVKPVTPAAAQQRNSDLVRGLIPRGLVPSNGVRVMIRDIPLTDLIAMACRVAAYEVAGPSWMSDERFEIEANIPKGAKKEDLNGMLLSLLEDRFDLRWHRADRIGRGYELVLGKRKLGLIESAPNPAIPNSADGHNSDDAPRPVLKSAGLFPGALGYSNVTSAILCERLSHLIHAPVTDSTGLKGSYDVVFERPTDPGARESGDWVFTAIEDLGLRLQPIKTTLAEIVIDGVLKTPKPN